MSPPKRARTRASLTKAERADLEERESRVVWEPIVAFDRKPSSDPDDHGDQPYEPGPSLMDRERRGSFSIDRNDAWSGGVVVHANDGKKQVDLMLDRAQFELLLEGGHRHLLGIHKDWIEGHPDRAVTCEHCDGAGIRPGGIT